MSLTASAVHLYGGRIAHSTLHPARSCENMLHLSRGWIRCKNLLIIGPQCIHARMWLSNAYMQLHRSGEAL